jgi:hypothetical protein
MATLLEHVSRLYVMTIDKLRATACMDGALHLWSTSSNFVRPNLSIENAHVKGTETGSMVYSIDGRTILTRGGDDTVKRTSYQDVHHLHCLLYS